MMEILKADYAKYECSFCFGRFFEILILKKRRFKNIDNDIFCCENCLENAVTNYHKYLKRRCFSYQSKNNLQEMK